MHGWDAIGRRRNCHQVRCKIRWWHEWKLGKGISWPTYRDEKIYPQGQKEIKQENPDHAQYFILWPKPEVGCKRSNYSERKKSVACANKNFQPKARRDDLSELKTGLAEERVNSVYKQIVF